MNITGKITGITYKIDVAETLKKVDIADFDINAVPSVCLVKDNHSEAAISKWVSPKRTRSYPFERVYNSLTFPRKITVIPVVKDEGAVGDRDFIQWDTVSLMSLLDVFVIFAYYDKAEINPRNSRKITNQKFENEYVLSKIKEINEYHSSALHWNLNELNTNFQTIINRAKEAYLKIEKETKVKLHCVSSIDRFREKIGGDVSMFMEFSRAKAAEAQQREYVTLQPKESLTTLSKAKITINNYLGGQYFLTVDEIKIQNDVVYLIECKHSKSSKLPSKGDIKDGLLKMILYSNLYEVMVDGKKVRSKAVLSLSSTKLKGNITSTSSTLEIDSFLKENRFSEQQIMFLKNLFREAQQNNFITQIRYSK